MDRLIDRLHPVQRDKMVFASRIRIFMGQPDRVALHLIHFANVAAV